MVSLFFYWLTGLVAPGAAWLPLAQVPDVPPPDTDRPTVTVCYGIALVCAIIVLLIVCFPSRKQP